jgi:hypothetical protein
MEHAASAGALLSDAALGLTIDHDGSNDHGDVTMWSDIDTPAPLTTQRQSQRTRNTALRAHARSQARAWSESRSSPRNKFEFGLWAGKLILGTKEDRRA